MTGSTRTDKEPDHNRDTKPKDKAQDQAQDQDGMSGFLGWIEKIGNKLPDPFWLFVILAGVVAVSSWLASKAGLSAVDPASGEEIHVESLLTGENISRMVTDAVENFIAFPPLGVILATMLGVAVAAEATGTPLAFLSANVWSLPTRADTPPFGPGFAPARTSFEQRREQSARGMIAGFYDVGLADLNRARAALAA